MIASACSYEVLTVTGLRDIASDPEQAGSAARPNASRLVRQPRHRLLYRDIRADLIGVG